MQQHIPARADFRQASNRSPMRRGLKYARRRWGRLHSRRRFKPIPDEEGTEIEVTMLETARIADASNRSPMRRGLKSRIGSIPPGADDELQTDPR